MDFNRNIIGYLDQWRHNNDRKPLIVRGARQVGKTSAVLLFGKRHFDHVVHMNFEKTEHSRLFPVGTTRADLEKIVPLAFGQPIVPGKTLLFLDEIQEAPYMLPVLRFLYEERPDVHVIAAGSLLEVRLKEEALPFPVGRVEYAYLRPLDFFEFLSAIDEQSSLAYLKEVSLTQRIPAGIHEKLLSLFAEYALIGGMPEAVKVYAVSRNIAAVNAVYSNLFTSFQDDVYKYASHASAKYVGFVLTNAPLFAGLSITYEKFSGSVYKSREMHNSFDLLEQAMLIAAIRATKATNLPLVPQQKKPPKLIFLDVGLVNFHMGIQKEFLTMKNLSDFYHGRIAEQIVAQQLLSSSTTRSPHLFYWYKKGGSEAEVDFCLVHEGTVVGVEVKSGKGGRLRSAHEFLKTHPTGKIIRVYGGPLEWDGKIVSLPFYLLPRWYDAVI